MDENDRDGTHVEHHGDGDVNLPATGSAPAIGQDEPADEPAGEATPEDAETAE